MQRLIPLILLSLLLSCSSDKKQKSIRVAGEGKIRIMPNLVILTIDISFTNPRMVESVRQAQMTVDTVINILEKFGDRNKDIKTSSISANKRYEYINNREQFVGFQASQSVDFVLKDLSKFTQLTGKLLETKINSISQIQFGHSKSDSLLREADLLAYDDALKSATKLTNRANVKLGKLLFLSNNSSTSDNEVYSNGNSINTYSKAYGGRGFKISPEVIEFKRQVITEFEISN